MAVQGAALIIAAIFSAIGQGVSTSLSNNAIDDANKEGLRLANIKREDDLRLAAENKKLNEAYLKLRKKEGREARETEMFGRKERAEERAFGRQRAGFADQISLLNRNDAMRNQLVSIWKGGK